MRNEPDVHWRDGVHFGLEHRAGERLSAKNQGLTETVDAVGDAPRIVDAELKSQREAVGRRVQSVPLRVSDRAMRWRAESIQLANSWCHRRPNSCSCCWIPRRALFDGDVDSTCRCRVGTDHLDHPHDDACRVPLQGRDERVKRMPVRDPWLSGECEP